MPRPNKETGRAWYFKSAARWFILAAARLDVPDGAVSGAAR